MTEQKQENIHSGQTFFQNIVSPIEIEIFIGKFWK